MNAKELAAKLTGCEYRKEITKELAAEAKSNGLVVVFGASDDLMEFRGAIYDEHGCYDGGIAKVDSKGLLPERENIDDDADLKDYFKRIDGAVDIEALWCAEPDYSWTFKTTIPHQTFEITEDGEPYCRGIVFALSDAAA